MILKICALKRIGHVKHLSPAVKQTTFRQTLLDALFDGVDYVLRENKLCYYPHDRHGFRFPLQMETAYDDVNCIIFSVNQKAMVY